MPVHLQPMACNIQSKQRQENKTRSAMLENKRLRDKSHKQKHKNSGIRNMKKEPVDLGENNQKTCSTYPERCRISVMNRKYM